MKIQVTNCKLTEIFRLSV